MIFWTFFLPGTALALTLYFYFINSIFRGRKSKNRIDPNTPLKPVKRELILFGLSSVTLFFFFGFVTDYIKLHDIGFMYNDTPTNISEFVYMVASFFIAFIIHDIYFYWTHRMLHIPFMYKYVHSWHHRSHDTNAWSAFSFHPVEAIFQIGIIPLMTLIFPVHELALIFYSVLLLLISVYGHCGYELRPTKPKSFDVFNSSLHHFQHHRYVHYNFGIYLTLWDKLFGTEYPQYESELNEVRKRINGADPS